MIKKKQEFLTETKLSDLFTKIKDKIDLGYTLAGSGIQRLSEPPENTGPTTMYYSVFLNTPEA